MMYMLKTKNPGFEITGASDTAESVGILKSGTEIDIVILDINLDGENSLDAMPKFCSFCAISQRQCRQNCSSGTSGKNMLENGRQFSYSTETFMWAGLVAGLTNSVLGNTFSYLFYPALKIPQAGTAVQEIYVVTRSLLFANCFGGTITNLIDKIISATVSLFVYRIVQRIKRRITMGGGDTA